MTVIGSHKIFDKKLFRKLFADEDSVFKKLFGELLNKGVELINKQKKNAKKEILRFMDKLLCSH